MSDKANIFINTLLGVFKTVENRLLEQGLEKKCRKCDERT